MSESETAKLLYGPSFSTLRKATFDRGWELAEEGIRRILYIESNNRASDDVADAWAAEHPALAIEVTTLDDVVDHCYEQLFGVAETLGRQERLRLIEQALIDVDEAGDLNGGPALLEEFSQVFATVEAAGISTVEMLRESLADTTLPERIRDPTVTAFERYTALRDDYTNERTQPRNERIRAVAEAEPSLQTCYPSVDVVIVADRRSLPSVEYQLLDRLANEFAFFATLPAIHEDTDGIGTDRAIADCFEAFQALGCDPEYVPPAEEETSTHEIAQQLYVLSEHDSHETATALDDIVWHEAPTPEREVRHVARSIRQQLADGIPPEEIAVVVPGLISYREQLADSFDAYEIPYVSYANKVLQQTHVGEAVLQLVSLCSENPQTDTLVELVSNPIVGIDDVDPSTVAAMNRRLPSQDCTRLLTELSNEGYTTTATQLEQILDDCQMVRASEVTPTTAMEQIETLLDQLIASHVANHTNSGDRVDATLEQRTLSQIQSVLDSVSEVAALGLVDDPVDRIERALSDVRAPAPKQDTTGRVEVMGLLDARGKAFEHMYLIGATADALPASPQRPLFFEEIEDIVPALQTDPDAVVDSDPQLDARYEVATLLASTQTAHFTTPEATINDDTVLPSPILDELARVTELEPSEPLAVHGTAEDLQRTLAKSDTAELHNMVEACVAAGDLTDSQATRLKDGAECAAHRSDITLSDYDGQLDTSTVEAVFSDEKLERLSPSRLKGYAKCGFAYFMNRGLGLDAPDDISTEPDTLDIGDVVHETLERFFSRLQTTPGEPVDLSDYDFEMLEMQLLTAALDAEAELDLPYDSPFYTTWKSHLLAGLATPAENDHYDASTTGQPAPESEHSRRDRGFFLRFLEEEYNNDSELHPAWFETPVGFDHDTPTFELPLPDGTTATISGVIDRIDITQDVISEPASVFDYKTGSTNLKRTVEGVEFQLPLYAIAATHGIATTTDQPSAAITVDAHFYDIDVPNGVSRKGPLSERVGDGPTDPSYEAFLEDLTPRRVHQIDEAIRNGAFHPSVLGPREAGCKYCDYSDVCDVRHHDRYDLIEHIDEENATAYVADRSREIAVEDRLPGGSDA
jgi:ATP-dependent helicase/nuclease subunit B